MFRLVVPILIVALPPTLAAQPRTSATVVVTAHAEEVPFQSLARDVVVVTRDDISLRGGTFGQTLVLVDGARLNSSQSGHHNSDIPVPLEEIERIEILLGP